MARKLIGTAVTDENGRATITYTGTGAGQLNIVAENGTFQSETYKLIDGLWVDMGTSNNYSDWRTSPTIDIAKNTEYTTISPKDSTIFSSRAVDLATGTNCIEFDVNINVHTAFLSLRQNNTSVTNLSNEYLGIDSSLNQWHHIRLEWNETQYRAIVDDNVKDYRTFSNTPNRFQFSINANTGLDIKYKNFVMYTI